MKKLYISLLFIFILVSGSEAQTLLANYPLVENGEDATQNNGEMVLINAPFQSGGVYSNGIYNGDDTTGSVIRTPNINSLNFSDFAVRLEFYAEEYPDFSKPIIVGGSSWRWIGVYMDETGKLSLMFNDGHFFHTEYSASLNTWNTIIFAFNEQSQTIRLALNGRLIVDETVALLEHHANGNFCNEHPGNGITFKGYWRNLEIYDSFVISSISETGLQGIEILQTGGCLSVNIPDNEKTVRLQIIDMSGKTVQKANLSGGLNKVNMSFSEPGSYILSFSNNTGQRTVKKIILSH